MARWDRDFIHSAVDGSLETRWRHLTSAPDARAILMVLLHRFGVQCDVTCKQKNAAHFRPPQKRSRGLGDGSRGYHGHEPLQIHAGDTFDQSRNTLDLLDLMHIGKPALNSHLAAVSHNLQFELAGGWI